MYTENFKDKKTGLTHKQLIFCYKIASLDCGVEAAREAKYKGDDSALAVIACQNMKKPHIKKKIDELMGFRLEKLDITADKVLVEIAKIAFQDIDLCSDSPVKVSDKRAALELLGKHHKLFVEKHELTGADSTPLMPSLSPEEAAIISKQLDQEY